MSLQTFDPVRERPTFDPRVNLSRDAELLAGEGGVPAYRTWVNAECAVLGRHLKPEEEVYLDYARRVAIPVLRRISGGGAVFHDPGVLNYSIVCEIERAGWNLEESLRRLSEPLLRTLDGFGLKWSWEGANNVYVGGKKVSGSAQARRKGRVLHHGSVLVTADLERMGRVLRPGGRSRFAAVANLCEFVPGLDVETLRRELTAELAVFINERGSQ